MYADVFWVLKIYVSEALARFARSRNISTYMFCRYISGSCPPPQYQKAGYATVKGPSHIQHGARPTSLRAKKRIFARMTAGVCSITAGSAAILGDRPAFAGHQNLFLIQRFSNGRISDLKNMTCPNFRCSIYASSGRRRTPGRTSGGVRASTDLLITDRNSEGARPYIDWASHDSR